MNVMLYQHHTAKHNIPPWSDLHNPPPVDNTMLFAAIDRGQLKLRLIQAYPRKQQDWMDWGLPEFKPLN